MNNIITPFADIIGANTLTGFNDLLVASHKESLRPTRQDSSRNLLIAIDVQKDFIEGGSLPVTGAKADVERLCRFIYDNMEGITDIVPSMDTHQPYQIFFPSWWIDKDGKNPSPFTPITEQDLANGTYRAVIRPLDSEDYVRGLKKAGNKDLFLWSYHCIEGTDGHALETSFANMLYFYEVTRKTIIRPIVKGKDPLSEMYGIFKPEYSKLDYIDTKSLNMVEQGAYDKVIIAGEAKSHCVLESIRQLLEFYQNKPEITSKVYLLEDCMSVIGGFESQTEAAFQEFKTKYKVNIVKSTDLIL